MLIYLIILNLIISSQLFINIDDFIKVYNFILKNLE